MTCAASAFITAAEWKGRGSSLARRLASEQNDCLRRVTGAYKSTPIAMLEELTGCPPINLVLAKQAARFEIRATEEKTGVWRGAWERIKLLVQSARGRKRRKTLADPMLQATDALDRKSLKTRCEEAWQALQATESQGNRRLSGIVKWKTQKMI